MLFHWHFYANEVVEYLTKVVGEIDANLRLRLG